MGEKISERWKYAQLLVGSQRCGNMGGCKDHRGVEVWVVVRTQSGVEVLGSQSCGSMSRC